MARVTYLGSEAASLYSIYSRGSFFAAQYVGGVFVILFSVLYCCEDDAIYRIFVFVYLMIGVVGTNILCHVRNGFCFCMTF